MRINIVLDTNVLLSALRSRQGASYALLSLLGRNLDFGIHVSVPLVLEYEEVLKRQSKQLGLTFQDIDDVLDYLCSIATHHDVFFLWRPCLPDADDDMLLELAVVASCNYIVTHNVRDFSGCERFQVQAVAPGTLLKRIRG
jgi:putative PIN family toxin of toxin-antitoxin system